MEKRLVVVLLCVLLSATYLFPQSQSNTADLTGTVRDQSGAVLPGVEVVATNVQTGISRSAVSGDEGFYRLPLLPPGQWEVRAALEGFSTKVLTGIRLTVGQYASLDIGLELSAISSEVIVSTNANIVEQDKTVQASTIQQEEIDNLPINGRNFLDFTLLTPGVTDRHTLTNFGVPQAPTGGLSFGGQDQRSTYVTIDGADNMDVVSSSVRGTLSQEAIQEFQISRNSFAAEFGRARGGVINIVSKTGTNAYHGNAFFFFRNNSLDARNAFAFGPNKSPIDPDYRRYQWGGTFGGPIVEDRTFFFASYERLDRDESIFVTFLDDTKIFEPTQSQMDLFGFLGSTGIPTLQVMSAAFIHPQFGVLRTLESNFPGTLDLFESESGTFPFTADSDTASFRLDHQFSDANAFYGRFNFDDSFNNGVSFGALQGVSNGVSFDSRDYALVFGDSHIFSPNVLNDVKFQYARREFAVPTNDPVGPELLLDGVAIFGREFNNPSAYKGDILQFVENFSVIKGNHSLKAGVDFTYWNYEGFAEVFSGGQFRFGEAIPLANLLDSLLGVGTADGLKAQLDGALGRPDLVSNVDQPVSTVQSFNFGLPITYLQSFGDPTTKQSYSQLAFYFQDTWKVRDNFTLNLGIRYDTDFPTATLNITTTAPPFDLTDGTVVDRNNFAPRIGFSWDPQGNGSTVIRGGYGLFYGNLFQALGFVGKVLSGQLFQVFLPVTGLPGFDVDSTDVFAFYQETGMVGEAALDALGIVPGTTPRGILPMAGNVVSPYSHQVSLGFERRLATDWSVSLDYVLNKGVHLVRSRDINVRKIGENQFALPGLDPRYIQIGMIETSGSSIYHGFTAALRKRFSQRYAVNVAYTLGKAIDDTTDFSTQNQANDQTNLSGERSLSTFDQRHRLVMSGIWQSPYTVGSGNGFTKSLFADWTVSPIVTWSSGKFFNLLLGYDKNGDGHANTDRPVLTDGNLAGRNTGQGPPFTAMDIRLSRRFNLPRDSTYFEFIFETFNLFNHVNYSGVNSTVGALQLTTSSVEGSKAIPANQPLGFTSAFDPRQIQFGFRFNF